MAFKLSFEGKDVKNREVKGHGDCWFMWLITLEVWGGVPGCCTRGCSGLRTLHLGLSSLSPALGYSVSSFSNGFPGCPGEGPRFSAPRRPSTSSLRHPSLGEESTHALIAPDEQVSKQLTHPSLLVWVGTEVRKYGAFSQ